MKKNTRTEEKENENEKANVNPYKILSGEEIESCRDAFVQFDEDQSGSIDLWELKKVLQSMGQRPTEKELVSLISEVDDNNSNSIDFSEFLRVVAKQKLETVNAEKEREQDILDAWKAVGGGAQEGEEKREDDIEGNNRRRTGYVDTGRLIKIIRDDFELEIDIEEMLKQIDTSGDGKIDFEEFRALFTEMEEEQA